MKRGVWKLVLGIVALLIAAAGGLLWSAHRRADHVFERQDRRVREMLGEIRSRPNRRARLYGPVKPGDGWGDYELAMVKFEAIPNPEAEEIPGVNGEPDFVADPEALEDFFGKYDPLLELLRESNRCSEFHPTYHYEAGFSMNLPNVTTAIRTSRILSGRADHFADSGRGAGALESLVLGLAVAHDTGRSGPIVNHLVLIVCEGIEAEALRTLLREHEFKAADLESFAAQLDRLWEARPPLSDALATEDAVVRRSLVDVGQTGGTLNVTGRAKEDLSWGRSWRYLYSRRLACAGALGELEGVFAQSAALRGQPEHLRAAGMSRIADEVRSSQNPVVLQVFPGLGGLWRREMIAQMNWTLMRVATAIAWHQAEKGSSPATLADLVPRHLPRVPICPLTGLPLGYRDGAVWSPGVNGVDDGGKPGKSDDVDAPDGDVVWPVKRK